MTATDLPARLAAALTDIPTGVDGYECRIPDRRHREMIAAAFMGVRDERMASLVARLADAEARADKAEEQLATARQSNAEYDEMLQQLHASRDAQIERARTAEAQVAAIRRFVVDVYGEDYDDEDVPAAVERLMRHLVAHEADVRRIHQSKSEALGRREAQVAALGARLIGASIHAYRLMNTVAPGTPAWDALVDLRIALDGPGRPDDPEEIRRLAEATTEEKNDEG